MRNESHSPSGREPDNELGGVPTVLRDAPLASYLGWNLTVAGFHSGRVCNYVVGEIPFGPEVMQSRRAT